MKKNENKVLLTPEEYERRIDFYRNEIERLKSESAKHSKSRKSNKDDIKRIHREISAIKNNEIKPVKKEISKLNNSISKGEMDFEESLYRMIKLSRNYFYRASNSEIDDENNESLTFKEFLEELKKLAEKIDVLRTDRINLVSAKEDELEELKLLLSIIHFKRENIRDTKIYIEGLNNSVDSNVIDMRSYASEIGFLTDDYIREKDTYVPKVYKKEK